MEEQKFKNSCKIVNNQQGIAIYSKCAEGKTFVHANCVAWRSVVGDAIQVNQKRPQVSSAVFGFVSIPP
jgi:hypothetical protein